MNPPTYFSIQDPFHIVVIRITFAEAYKFVLSPAQAVVIRIEYLLSTILKEKLISAHIMAAENLQPISVVEIEAKVVVSDSSNEQHVLKQILRIDMIQKPLEIVALQLFAYFQATSYITRTHFSGT